MSEKSVTFPRPEEGSAPQAIPEVNEEGQELQGRVSSSCSSSKPAKRQLFDQLGENDNTQGKEKKLKGDVPGGLEDDENAEEDQKISFLKRLSSNIESEIEFFGEGKVSMFPYLNASLKLQKRISNETTMKVLGSIGSSKIKELDDKWKNFWERQKQLTLKQNELKLKQEELISEQEKLFTDAIESASSSENPN